MTIPTHYQRIGGEAKARELVDRFHDHMRNQACASVFRPDAADSLK